MAARRPVGRNRDQPGRAAPAAAGYTAVLCVAGGCAGPAAGTVLDGLRAAVRASRGGVLVSAGCTLGPVACRLRPAAPLVVVQPCDARREPCGPPLRVGPLRGAADVAALATWLRAGALDVGLLPAHLRAVHRDLAAAAGN